MSSRYATQTLTRMYNQPTIRLPNGKTQGTLYKNPMDCLLKTVRTEGIFGWYKGNSDHIKAVLRC